MRLGQYLHHSPIAAKTATIRFSALASRLCASAAASKNKQNLAPFPHHTRSQRKTVSLYASGEFSSTFPTVDKENY